MATLGSHYYTWHREQRKQGLGLPIGLDLSRAVARLVMLSWDQDFLRKAQANQLTTYMYSRFVDDCLNGMKALQPGWRWSTEEGRMVHHPHLVEEDRDTPADLRTMREVVKLGSSIHPMVQLTGDCPSANTTGKMPVLDCQVWLEGSTLYYEHYRKPMANPMMMMQVSAMPAGMKRTSLTQEVVRVRRNTKPELSWETSVKHLNQLMARMKASGYSSSYRFQVLKSGVTGYDKMRAEELRGGRPVNRPRTWEEDQRQTRKEDQSKNWFRKGGFDVPLFVPHTPGGELANKIRAKEAENNQGRKIRFKVIEKGGVSLEQKLRRSNPWSGEPCGRPRCFQCRRPGGGNCWREGVCYTLWCLECGEMVAAYHGETGRNGYCRGLEHLDSLEAKDENKSVLWLHSVTHHGSREVEYAMKVTGCYKDCLDRQLMERVTISNFRGPILMNRRNEMGGVRVERQSYRRWGGE